MRITVDLPEDLVRQAVRLSGSAKKKDAVRRALEEFVQRRRLERLLATPGTITIRDKSQQMEALELADG